MTTARWRRRSIAHGDIAQNSANLADDRQVPSTYAGEVRTRPVVLEICGAEHQRRFGTLKSVPNWLGRADDEYSAQQIRRIRPPPPRGRFARNWLLATLGRD